MTDHSHLHEEQLASEVVFQGKLRSPARPGPPSQPRRKPARIRQAPRRRCSPGPPRQRQASIRAPVPLPLRRAFPRTAGGQDRRRRRHPDHCPARAARRNRPTKRRLGVCRVMHPCIGYSDERIEIFGARLQLVGAPQLDHNEFLDVLELSPAEAWKRCARAKSPMPRRSLPSIGWKIFWPEVSASRLGDTPCQRGLQTDPCRLCLAVLQHGLPISLRLDLKANGYQGPLGEADRLRG